MEEHAVDHRRQAKHATPIHVVSKHQLLRIDLIFRNLNLKYFEGELNFKCYLNISGNCYLEDNDLVGNPVRGIKDYHIHLINSPGACQIQCQADDDCQFWMWNGPNARANKNTCWLTTSNEHSTTQVGKVSGPKLCSGKSKPKDICNKRCINCILIYILLIFLIPVYCI